MNQGKTLPQLDIKSEESHASLRVAIDHRILLRVIPSNEFADRNIPKYLISPITSSMSGALIKGVLISLFYVLAILRGSFSESILF